MIRRSPLIAVPMLALLVVSCASTPDQPSRPDRPDRPDLPSRQPTLVGTEWRLIHFQSSEDSIGMIRPGRDEVYTLRLEPDGTLAAGLFCNRGSGRWTSADSARSMGSITLELKAVTMAACPPSPLERIARDLANVRSFVIRDGRLHLNLVLDGGDYVWEPN